MKDALSIIPEFFFDICGIFIPGLALLSALCWMGFIPLAMLPDDTYKAIGVVLASYLVGHLLFSFSQRSVAWLADIIHIEPRKTLQDSKYPLGKLLTSRIEAKWCLEPNCLPQEVIYELCRNYVHVRDNERSSFLRKEQTYGELSRSMVTVSLLCAVLVWFSSRPEGARLLPFIVLLVSAVGFFLRYLRARHIDAELVYTNLIVLLQEEEETNLRRGGGEIAVKAA